MALATLNGASAYFYLCLAKVQFRCCAVPLACIFTTVAVVAAQEGELVGVGQPPLEPNGRAPIMLGKKVYREVSPLNPGGLAPKWMRDVIMGQDD